MLAWLINGWNIKYNLSPRAVDISRYITVYNNIMPRLNCAVNCKYLELNSRNYLKIID